MLSILRVLILVASLLCCEAFAATLTVGQGSAQPGETAVTVPLTLALSPGDNVAALQADVGFDPDMLSLSSISAGPSATAVNKNVSFSVQAPGSVRLIIAGLNQNAISDGVVANMIFGVMQGTPAGAQAIRLAEVLAADPTGSAVPVSALPGDITVCIESGEGEGEGEAPPGTCCVGGTLSPDDYGRPNAGDLLTLTMGVLALLLAPRQGKTSRC